MTTDSNDALGQSKEPLRMKLCVHLSTGAKNEHVVELSQETHEGAEKILDHLRMINAVLTGETKYLCLGDPLIVYNPSCIVFIEVDFIGPEEWRKRMFKESIGFKPQREQR